MRVNVVSAKGFMAKTSPQTWRLPKTGLVLVTGPNGAGKSTIIEAVSYALWGKSIRGTDPRNGPGGVTLESDNLTVTRDWPHKHNVLTVSDDVAYENGTKGQEALELRIGGHELWRRACVFSSSDASLFTQSTDAERKKLLESVLELERFDMALVQCRTVIAGLDGKKSELDRIIERQKGLVDAAKARLDDVNEALVNLGDIPDEATVKTKLAKLEFFKEAVRKTQADLSAGNTELQNIARGFGRFDAKLAELAELAERLKASVCTVCTQEITHSTKERITSELSQARAEADKAKKDTESQKWLLETELAELREELEALSRQYTEHASFAQSLENTTRQYTAFKDNKERILKAGAEAQKLLDQARKDVAETEYTLAYEEACETILGTKGLRAHLLTGALTSVETMANIWLDKIARTDAPLKLKLNAYTERKSGAIANAISLEIDGAGGGKGYRGASGGERRRIDVAIMLALAELASNANRTGYKQSTLFFDEVFDALDEDGIVAVSEAITELAQERCVVLISHSDSLIKHVKPLQHWRL